MPDHRRVGRQRLDVVANQFGHIGEWATAIATSCPTQGVAATGAPTAGRVCETGIRVFPHVEETILVYDERARTLTYIGAGLPAFVAEARNRRQVTTLADQRARVRVDATMEMRGIAGQFLAIPLRVWLTREGKKTLEDLKHYVELGHPSPRKQRRLRRARAHAAGDSAVR